MAETNEERIARLEEHSEASDKTLDKIEKLAEKIAADLVTLQASVTQLTIKQNEMAPSVQTLKDGLVFWRIARWVIGAMFLAGSYAVGAIDWLRAHVHLFSR